MTTTLAAINFAVAMLPGNFFDPLNIVLGFVCLLIATKLTSKYIKE